MERYGKIAVPGAAIGLVLSVLVGLIAGVGLGTVLLRGIISAVVMGVGSAGLYAAAERLLPGLTDEGAAAGNDVTDGAGAEGESETGERAVHSPGDHLNIVVEDESDEADAAPSDAAPENNDAATEVEEAEEVEDTQPEPTEAPQPNDESEDDDVDDDLVEEIEEQSVDDAEAVMNQAIAEEKDGSGVEIDDAVLDEMPDIGSFAGSFGSDGGSDQSDQADDGAFPNSSGGSGQQNAGGSAGNDPAEIAKALKTMLSRDGKE